MGFSFGSGFGMEEGNKERNPTRTGEGGIDGDPMQEKRKGEETSNPVVNTKSDPKGKPSPSRKKKNRQLTSNLTYSLDQCRKFTNLLINIIPPSSFNGIVALPPSSFLVCL